jgi:AcrR family transcriptional regulator
MSPEITEEYAEFRRRQILTAAWRSFAENGIRGTTIRGIADSLGLSTGIVYTYFESKDQIVRALQEMSSEQNQELLAQLDRSASFQEAIDGLFDYLFECCSEEDLRAGARANLVSWSEALKQEDFRTGFVEIFQQLREGLTDIARRGVRNGELREDLDAEALAGLILALVSGLQVQAALLEGLDLHPLFQTARETLRARIDRSGS